MRKKLVTSCPISISPKAFGNFTQTKAKEKRPNDKTKHVGGDENDDGERTEPGVTDGAADVSRDIWSGEVPESQPHHPDRRAGVELLKFEVWKWRREKKSERPKLRHERVDHGAMAHAAWLARTLPSFTANLSNELFYYAMEYDDL
nr:hypothetical protein Iba_chr04fCG1000 [Ipomoea batatas]